MSKQHTPGPWSLESDGSVCMGGQSCIPLDHCGPDGSTKETLLANARVIAASPDMHALLKAFVNNPALVHWCTQYLDEDHDIAKLWDTIKAARTVLAKVQP